MTKVLPKKEVNNLVSILRNTPQARFEIAETEESIVVTWRKQEVFNALLKDRKNWIVWHKDDLFVPVESDNRSSTQPRNR